MNPERGRLHRFCGSVATHVSLLAVCTALLWINWALETQWWVLSLLTVSAVVPVFLIAAVVSILVDLRRGTRSWTHALVLGCHAIMLAECAWHWVDLVDISWGP